MGYNDPSQGLGQILDAIKKGPRGGKQAPTDRKLIGVAKGQELPYSTYITPETPYGRRYPDASGKLQSVKARYYQGDEWTQIAGLAPEYLAQIQTSMVQAGILKPGKFVHGAPDPTTRKAVTELLTEANGAGMTWQDYLHQRLQINGGMGGAQQGPVKQPLEIRLANPDTIKEQVKSDATTLLGSRAAAGDPQHYVDEIQNQERLQQTQIYNQTGAGYAGGTGGTTVDPAEIDALLTKEHPAEAEVNATIGQKAQQFIQLFGGANPGLSNLGPT